MIHGAQAQFASLVPADAPNLYDMISLPERIKKEKNK